MSQVTYVMVVGLVLPGCIPAMAALGRSAAVVFVAPLIGVGLAALAAECEFVIGGTLLFWYVILVLLANVAAAGWWGLHRSEREQDRAGWWWVISTVVVLAAALAVPLSGLRSGMIDWDGNVIWLLHSLLVSGGHQALWAGLHNNAYGFADPDYPLLIPASGGLTFALVGRGDLHHAVAVLAVLNACAMGVVGSGIAEVARRSGRPAKMAALVLAGATGMAGFAVAGDFGVNGYADMLWSAAAVGAVVWGLVLPRSGPALATAWICAIVAGLTKNEGLTSSLILLALIALRYRPVSLSWLRGRAPRSGDGGGKIRPLLGAWAARAGLFLLPALPALTWLVIERLLRLDDNFFGAPTPESIDSRIHATVDAMAAHLVILPIALAATLVGSVVLRRSRAAAGLGSPLWLWAAWLGPMVIIFATYVLGDQKIQGWLSGSIDRTTIFGQVVLYAELAMWGIVAIGGPAAGGRPADRPSLTESSPRRTGRDPDPVASPSHRPGPVVEVTVGSATT